MPTPSEPNNPLPQKLQPLIISAPFGNYVQPQSCTPTLGTFTAAARPGRLWRILKTVRYYPRLGAWVNKIGLRNPGIDCLADRVQSARIKPADKLISIHGFTDDDWWLLLEKAAALRPLGLELNMSCPNVGQIDWPTWLFQRAAETTAAAAQLLMVKLPPVNYRLMLEQALDAGINCFHCSNTLPVPRGGISGKPLKPVSLACVRDCLDICRRHGIDPLIVGGGGITSPADIDDYAAAGARRFAIGAKLMHPRYLLSHAALLPLRAQAELWATPPVKLPEAAAGHAAAETR